MRCLFVGTPEVAVPALDCLFESDHEVVGVLTRLDSRVGRGRKLSSSPVAKRAEELGLPVIKADSLRDPELLSQLEDLQADVAAVVAYGALVPEKALSIFRFGWLNLHFSLLPRWRGAAPVQRSIAAGDTKTGACVFEIEKGLDTGPVYASLEYNLDDEKTTGVVLNDLSRAGGPLIVEVLTSLENGTAIASPQSATGITLAPKITTADCLIDFSLPASKVVRQINSVSPLPGAFTFHADKRLKVAGARLNGSLPEGVASLAPGQVLLTKRSLLVGCGSGAVELLRVAPASKGWMEATAWARGARLSPDTVLDSAVEREN
ncbi:methionyl-tRNA formyltransferase [Actinomycetaceae bacterium TAE3-ERU4]|nr:methionyl-tRNA formyltransferase [Actinomycetaceae bacterium TAE3-ERU4]